MISNPCTHSALRWLRDQWLGFVHSDARILVWQAQGLEVPLVERFTAMENDDGHAATPDFFLRAVTPFADPSSHGFTLAAELAEYYEEARDDLRASGLDATWRCPSHRGPDDIAVLLRALGSLHRQHAGPGSVVSVQLEADRGVTGPAYLRWLACLARRAPRQLRFVLVKPAVSPAWAELVEEGLVRIADVAGARSAPPSNLAQRISYARCASAALAVDLLLTRRSHG